MKHLLGALAFSATCAMAEVQQPAATLVALDGAIGAGVPACIERFAGQPARIPAVFLKAPGRNAAITADVYLDGGALGAAWKKAVRFDAALESSHPALLEGIFVVPLPDGDRPGLFRVLILAAEDQQDQRVKIAEFGLRAVPSLELEESLAQWTSTPSQESRHLLAVFGKVQGLRETLLEWSLPFEDLGSEMPALIAPGTLAVGEQNATNEELSCDVAYGASLLLFRTNPANPSGVSQKVTNTRCLTVVNTPHHDDWRHSPFLHQLLIHQIRLLQHHE